MSTTITKSSSDHYGGNAIETSGWGGGVATVVVVEVAAVVEAGRVDPGSTWLNYE